MRTIKHNVFIFYRREGGEYTAKILRDCLDELERIDLEYAQSLPQIVE